MTLCALGDRAQPRVNIGDRLEDLINPADNPCQIGNARKKKNKAQSQAQRVLQQNAISQGNTTAENTPFVAKFEDMTLGTMALCYMKLPHDGVDLCVATLENIG